MLVSLKGAKSYIQNMNLLERTGLAENTLELTICLGSPASQDFSWQQLRRPPYSLSTDTYQGAIAQMGLKTRDAAVDTLTTLERNKTEIRSLCKGRVTQADNYEEKGFHTSYNNHSSVGVLLGKRLSFVPVEDIRQRERYIKGSQICRLCNKVQEALHRRVLYIGPVWKQDETVPLNQLIRTPFLMKLRWGKELVLTANHAPCSPNPILPGGSQSYLVGAMDPSVCLYF